METITVRPAEMRDVDALAVLERAVWAERGARTLEPEDIAAWYEEGSPLFLVAECGGALCGYYFGRFVEFDFDATDAFIAHERITDGAWHARCRHTPTATTAYGVSTASMRRGAGLLMSAHARRVWKAHGIRHSVGFTRLSGLHTYLCGIEQGHGGLPCAEDDAARWYAHACASLLGLRRFAACPIPPATGLPMPARPDPVLAFHARDNPIGLLRVVADYMPDPESRNYAAFIALSTADLP